jgi:hypothetical protein
VKITLGTSTIPSIVAARTTRVTSRPMGPARREQDRVIRRWCHVAASLGCCPRASRANGIFPGSYSIMTPDALLRDRAGDQLRPGAVQDDGTPGPGREIPRARTRASIRWACAAEPIHGVAATGWRTPTTARTWHLAGIRRGRHGAGRVRRP